MFEHSFFSLILLALMLVFANSYTAVSPTWMTSPFFRAGNNKVINRNTGNNTTPTYTFTFSSALTGVPNLAYGIKSYRGIDQLKETNFQIKRTGLTASTFSVSIQLYGSGNLFLLAVPFIAIDPSFPHHLNSFDNVAIQYGSTLTNITTASTSLTSFTRVIDYSQQSSANRYKSFATPLSGNKIVLYITSLCVVANPTTPFKLEISYQILNTTHYSWTAKVFQSSTVTKLHFSEIIYNQDDVMSAKKYSLINSAWISNGSANYISFPLALVDNTMLGLTDFGSANGTCGLDYNWDYMTNFNGLPHAISFSLSFPSPNSTATGGQNYVRSTLFYLKTWNCTAPYVYFNITADLCQDACASYYFFNYSAASCTPCHYSCYNCTLEYSQITCSQCEAGLKRVLSNNKCICQDGYFDDGYEPACNKCTDVDPNSLTCTYLINSSKPTTYYENIFNQTSWTTDILTDYSSLTCKSAHFVNSSKLCQPCPSYCTSCTDKLTCQNCSASPVAKLYTNNLCYLCTLTNCESCYPDNVCVTCKTGYVIESGACVTCASACQCQGWVLPKVNGTCSTLCGDGIKVGAQECDDNNTNDHDGCSSTCKTQACNVSCQCDGWTSPWVASNNSCTSICGDSLIRGNQQCDDGNTVSEDGCSSTCKNQSCSTSCLCGGWTLPKVNGTCSTICGDGILLGAQQCDDKNTNDHDGCSSTCTSEACNVSCKCDGWVAPWVNGSCSTLCGDGIKIGTQECDDGNTNDHDGCSATCLTESCNISCQCDGWILPWVNGSCSTDCGDGILIGLEQCDDSNQLDHDGCSSQCLLQPCDLSCQCDGWVSPWIQSENQCSTLCGDNFQRGKQECDDGNTIAGDGCSSQCKLQSCNVTCQCGGWILPWIPNKNSCSTLCGDSIIVGLEQCDDGNTNSHDGCSSKCIIQACDQSCQCDGWVLPWNSTLNSCNTSCGDGFKKGSEQCDDGNVLDGDGCDSTCHIENTALITAQMTQYPALVLFVMGLKIVGLQALNVIQSFQLITSSINLSTFQISPNIHGYNDQNNFFIPFSIEQYILKNFNFMYLVLIAFFLIGGLLQIFYATCKKNNQIVDTNEPQKNQDSIKSTSEEQFSMDAGDFTVHYKDQKKSKAQILTTSQNQITQTQTTTKYPNFWGSIIFRQIFFDILINLLCVFIFHFVTQIKEISIESFLKAETLSVTISMIILLSIIITLCAVGQHSFGQNHLKFNKGRALQYWLLIIGQKIVFSVLLGFKFYWNLQVILGLKFFLVTYYCCANIYFEHIQKVRSVITHFLHFLLILGVILNEHIFITYGIKESFPPLFMEYMYLALLCLVIFLSLAFYVREIMHKCQADYRHEQLQNVFAIANGEITAIFDVKNQQTSEDSAQQLNKSPRQKTNIFDDLLTRKSRKQIEEIDEPFQPVYLAGAMAKKIVTIKNLNSLKTPTESVNSQSRIPSTAKKANFQTTKKTSFGINQMQVIEDQNDERLEELNFSPSLKNKRQQDKRTTRKMTKSLFRPQQSAKVKFEEQKNIFSDSQNKTQEESETGLKRKKRRLALKNKKKGKSEKSVKEDQIFKSEEQQVADDVDQQINGILGNRKVFNDSKKQPRQATFYNRKRTLNLKQSTPKSVDERGTRNRIQSQHINHNNEPKSQNEDSDNFSLVFE